MQFIDFRKGRDNTQKIFHKKASTFAILLLFLGILLIPTSGFAVDKDYSSLRKETPSQLTPYYYSLKHNETIFEPEKRRISSQDDDVELLWNTSAERVEFIDSLMITDDYIPDILAGSYALNGSTGEIIYQFKKGNFLGLGDVNNDGLEEIITFEDDRDNDQGFSIFYCINASNGSVIWERKVISSWVYSVSVGNVTGDETNEVVVGVGDFEYRGNDYFYCLNGKSGNIIWRKHTNGYGRCTEIADVNDDGRNEVMAGTTATRVYCLEGDKGEVIWEFGEQLPHYAYFRVMCIDNLNDDPYKEILVEKYWGGDHVYGVCCLSGLNGGILWSWEQDWDAGAKGTFQSILTADIVPSIPGNEVIAGGVCGVYCLYGGDDPPIGGRQLWHAGRWNHLITAFVMTSDVGDVDGDGLLDVVAMTFFPEGGVYALNGQYGSLLWQYEGVHYYDGFYSILCVDLTNDTIPEVVAIGDYEDITGVYAFKSSFPQDNQAPNTPIVDGHSEGLSRRSCNYRAKTTDPDGDDLFYYFDWGDGTGDISERGSSGEQVFVSHSWIRAGNYTIRVKAIDEHGTDGNWSSPFSVNIFPAPYLDIEIDGGLGVRVLTQISQVILN